MQYGYVDQLQMKHALTCLTSAMETSLTLHLMLYQLLFLLVSDTQEP